MTRKDKSSVSASRMFDSSPFSPNFEMRSFSAQFRVNRGQEIKLEFLEKKRFISQLQRFFLSNTSFDEILLLLTSVVTRNFPLSASLSSASITASIVLLSSVSLSDSLKPAFLFPSKDSRIHHIDTPEALDRRSRVPFSFKEIVTPTVPFCLSLFVS